MSGELPPGPGGIGAHAWALASGLHRRGWPIHVVGPQDYVTPEATERFLADSPFPVTRLSSRRGRIRAAVHRAVQARRAVLAHRPDLVITSGGAATILWELTRITVIARNPMRRTAIVIHGSELASRGLRGVIYRRALRRADSVVAVSTLVAGRAEELRGGPVSIVHNGADPARVEAPPGAGTRFRAARGLGDGPLVIAVGNITERKGQHLVVDALPEIVQAHPDVRFVCLGRPTAAEELRTRARALGVEANLVILGQVDDQEIAAAFAAAAITTMTSTNTAAGDIEGFGIAVLEGACAGVPAVVTKGTGAAEAVAPGRTGLVATRTTLARSIVALLDDDDGRRRMGQAARQRVLDSCTWAHRVSDYAALWEDTFASRLVIISHTEHWRDGATTVAFGPTTREIDQLATLFGTVRHVAPLQSGTPPRSAIPAAAPNLTHVPLRPAPGGTPANRLRAVARIPRWMATIARESRRADVVHVRVPTGIAFAAFPVLTVLRRPRLRWIKYAGTWRPAARDPAVYRIQRAWLRSGLLRAKVTVNGDWPGEPPFVHPFDNPTLTEAELTAGRQAARAKDRHPPVRMLFVGRLEAEKGADRAVRLILALRRAGHPVVGELIGDGPLRPDLEVLASSDRDAIVLRGWLRRPELDRAYARSHLLLLPTRASEGFPKVIAEALANGVVPVATSVSCIGPVLEGAGAGFTLDPDATDSEWLDAVVHLLDPAVREPLARGGVEAASRWSYPQYLATVRTLIGHDGARTPTRAIETPNG